MKVFIPSKDRACQLHCLLESMITNLPNLNIDIHVLYKSSNSNFEEGYHQLFDYVENGKFDGIQGSFYIETNFENQFLKYLKDNCNDYVMLLTDDCVFYRKDETSENDIKELMQENVLCYSFRLGLNTTTQWYRTGAQQQHLNILGYEQIPPRYIKWNWKMRFPHTNYAYMMSWDGHIYRANQLLSWGNKYSFYNPRTYECRVTANIEDRKAVKEKYMMANETSSLFVNTINAVQKEPPPFGDKYKISPEELNELYLNGQVIDINTFSGLELSGSHDEISLKFRNI